ncbi:tbc1 domain family member whacked [Anaeramoeba ignava]|uniref:Tbc1 domain family member whacked n=1 Tax=Anaeramoeba ignava TaxID=1746090 RepID=A0A9Q0LQM4_ANAIG|nr:tbc1 domain family member whacked [Anaeramoeba ignava]
MSDKDFNIESDESLEINETKTNLNSNQETKTTEKFDEYGFLIDEENVQISQKKQKKIKSKEEQEEKKKVKWNQFFKNWNFYFEKKKKKIGKQVIKGIPNSLRKEAWLRLSGSFEMLSNEKYSELYNNCLKKKDPKFQEMIVNDVKRTFSTNRFYKEKDGKEKLIRVLTAIAAYDPQIGYCQGMSSIAGLLLFYMDEKESFLTFLSLLERYHMSGTFRPGFPLILIQMHQWKRSLEKNLPKIHQHFKENEIIPEYYANVWFITLFADLISFDSLLRIWDVFLFEGFPFIFKVGLSYLKIFQKQLLSFSMNEILHKIQNLDEFSIEELINTANSFQIRSEELVEWRDEFFIEHKNISLLFENQK